MKKTIITFIIIATASSLAHADWSAQKPTNCTGVIETRETPVSCPVFTQWMKKGDRDGQPSRYLQENGERTTINEVTLLQGWLNKHLNINISVDGVFGSETEKAVRSYQNKYAEYILNPWQEAYGAQSTGNFKNTSKWFANYLSGCLDPQANYDGDLPGYYQPFTDFSSPLATAAKNVTEYRCSPKKIYSWDRPDFVRRSVVRKRKSSPSGPSTPVVVIPGTVVTGVTLDPGTGERTIETISMANATEYEGWYYNIDHFIIYYLPDGTPIRIPQRTTEWTSELLNGDLRPYAGGNGTIRALISDSSKVETLFSVCHVVSSSPDKSDTGSYLARSCLNV